jgi:hypothetical protein
MEDAMRLLVGKRSLWQDPPLGAAQRRHHSCEGHSGVKTLAFTHAEV